MKSGPVTCQQPPGLREFIWLVTATGLAVLPHCLRLPIWIPLLYYGLTLARLYIAKRDKHGKQWTGMATLRQLAIITTLIGVYGHYGTLAGRDAGIALLVVLGGFKILESQTSRDFYICCFLGYFLIITNFLYTQTIPTALFMCLVIVIMTACLITYNDTGRRIPVVTRLRFSGVLLLQALPIMLILFLLFPRIPGPLWGLPRDAHSGRTGLDDEMMPGSVSQLILSDAVAFRVKFTGPTPEPDQLYWRGPVLWFSDGRKWTPGDAQATRSRGYMNTYGAPIRYEITIEPTQKNWLFPLEMPALVPEDAYLTTDFQLKTKLPLRERNRYTLVAYTHFRIATPDPAELQRALQLPYGHHGKTRELARTWRRETGSPGQIIDRALQWFRNENFYYTLTPPLLGEDSVDEFLFSTRKGFCEHYAAAFVILMRAAGIPARVVTGYLGGEMNPVGNYLIVRQRDAHAWAEVWLGEEGWKRVDPTAAVSPERVSNGIENALPDSLITIPLGLEDSVLARSVWEYFKNTWDAFNYQWNQWVLGYGQQRQLQFLSQFGMGDLDWRGMTIGLIMATGFIIIGIGYWLFRQSIPATDPARRVYDHFCAKLAGQGMARSLSEGPVDFACRVRSHRPDLARDVNRITSLYVDIRYGSQRGGLKILKQEVRRFNARRNRTLRGNL